MSDEENEGLILALKFGLLYNVVDIINITGIPFEKIKEISDFDVWKNQEPKKIQQDLLFAMGFVDKWMEKGMKVQAIEVKEIE